MLSDSDANNNNNDNDANVNANDNANANVNDTDAGNDNSNDDDANGDSDDNTDVDVGNTSRGGELEFSKMVSEADPNAQEEALRAAMTVATQNMDPTTAKLTMHDKSVIIMSSCIDVS